MTDRERRGPDRFTTGRRQVLATLGSAASVALAGCSVEVGDDSGQLTGSDDVDEQTPETGSGSSGGDRVETDGSSESEDENSESEGDSDWDTEKEEFEGWPGPLYDHRNTSYKANATLPSGDPEVVWQTSTGDGSIPPVVADGTVYTFANRPGRVTAVDAATGDVEWTFTADELAHGTSKTPALSEDHVYVSGKRSLFAIDRETGEQAWQFEVEGNVRDPAVDDGTVYIGTGGPCYALDTAGEKLWEELVGNRFPVAVVEDALYAGGWVLDKETGESRGRYNGGSETGPTVLGGRVFTADAVSLDCFEAGVDGDRVWQSPDLGAPVFSNLVLAHGHVYCYTRGTDTLHAHDISTGESVWTVERSMSESLAATPEALLVWDDGVRALNPADGSERWAVEIDASYGSPVPVDNTVYATADPIGEDDASLYAIE